MLLQDSEDIIARIRGISELGVQISIDDFGTGYSSLAYLKKFPIDIIKIDRSLTQGALTNKQDAAIATAIMSIGDAFSATIIAEGVETPEHYQFLLNKGCDCMQGYWISRPMSSDALMSWCQTDYPQLRKQQRKIKN
jgi:EAL domain-containing protein (putative c-di-GMP-specific phosphodiesterase class I)